MHRAYLELLHRAYLELHGDNHPPVTIVFGSSPLVSECVGEMDLSFHVRGAVVGFRYRIVVQELDAQATKVIQQEERSFSPIDDTSANKATVELRIIDIKRDVFRFAIAIEDTYEGLMSTSVGWGALVARKDGSFSLVRRGGSMKKSSRSATFFHASMCTRSSALLAQVRRIGSKHE